jgi:hypothetical protein
MALRRLTIAWRSSLLHLWDGTPSLDNRPAEQPPTFVGWRLMQPPTVSGDFRLPTNPFHFFFDHSLTGVIVQAKGLDIIGG